MKKREGYRKAFDGFDFEKVALYSEDDVERLMLDSGIVRNRLKIKSAINNAKRFVEVRREFGSFSEYLWGFAGDEVVIGDGCLTKSELSDEISKDLKRRGFSFVGTVIVYAFLQAIGIVNGHEDGCFRKI